MKTRFTLAALTLMLAGCVSAPATPVAPVQEGVTAHAQLAVHASAARAVLLAPATPDMIEYVEGDVGKVVLELYRDGGATPVQTATLLLDDGQGNNQLDDSIKFTQLGYQASYKIVAKAYHKTSPFDQIDNTLNGDAASIASCTTSFTTGVNPVVAVGSIAVQLRKQTFDGTSNATSLDIADGVVSDVVGTETITITP